MQPLIINIHHDDEPYPYTVRLASSGKSIAGFKTIGATDQWLKDNGGRFTSDPQENPQGYYREAQIATWAYQQILSNER